MASVSLSIKWGSFLICKIRRLDWNSKTDSILHSGPTCFIQCRGPRALSTQKRTHRLQAPDGRERARKGHGPCWAFVFALISPHICLLCWPGQLHSKQRPGPPAANASGSKLGTCLLCLLWGRRREQTAAFVSQVGYILHSIRAVKRWRDAKDPSQSKHFTLTRLSEGPFHWLCPLEVLQLWWEWILFSVFC